MAQDKENKTPNVPPLRFPEFESEWEKTLLGSLCEKISSGKDKLADNGTFKLYGSTGLIGKSNTKSCENGGLLIARVGANAGKLQLVKDECGVTDNALILKLKKEDSININFLYFYLTRFNLNRLIFGSGQPLITSNILKKLQLFCPPRLEQDRIVRLLNLCDERIATQSKIIEDLERLKSAIVDKIYSEVKGIEYRYGDIFRAVNERNKSVKYTKVIAASQEFGMVDRESLNLKVQFDTSSINTYKIIHAGDYVVHLRSFQGGFAFSEINGICSPAYTILRPNDKIVFGYLRYLFTSIAFINQLRLVTYGIRDGRSINVDEWLDMKIIIPSIKDQERILSIISIVERKLQIEMSIADKLNKQRQYLLSKMFI